jgi:hypothetical protein
MNETPGIHATGGMRSVTKDAMAGPSRQLVRTRETCRAAPAISSPSTYRYVAQAYFGYAFAVFILSSADRSPRASFTTSSAPQKRMKNRRGSSLSMWLRNAVTSIPFSRVAGEMLLFNRRLEWPLLF